MTKNQKLKIIICNRLALDTSGFGLIVSKDLPGHCFQEVQWGSSHKKNVIMI